MFHVCIASVKLQILLLALKNRRPHKDGGIRERNIMEKYRTESMNSTPRLRSVLEEATAPESEWDPSGSYTGTPRDEDEKPVQDVDDL